MHLTAYFSIFSAALCVQATFSSGQHGCQIQQTRLLQ